MSKPEMKVLVRGDERHAFKPHMWANYIALANRNGWKPDVPSYYLLADGFEVSDADAASLADALDRFLDTVETYPHYRMRSVGNLGEVHEVIVEVDRLPELCKFCRGGGFLITG